VDLVRLLIDLPEAWNVTQLDQLSENEVDENAKKKSSKSPVKRGKGPKFGEVKCGYIIAVGQNGILTHVSPRYAKSYSEPLARIADTDWFFDFIRSWNEPLREQLISASSKDRSLVKMMRKMEQCDEREMDEIARQEPMPTVVSAFKNHPLYVLERDILKFEVLRPNHSAPVAKVHEHDVYLRKDLSPIHTSDKWIQEGMQVKAGEKPVLEMIKRSMVNWDTVRKTWVDEDQAEMSEYYGDWQIEKFQPPVAENGLVPKNRYGNVYLFKPDMLPIGTVHLPGYPHLDKSVKKIGIDVAPAMTGWTVEGYWSIPQLEGWVICKENVDLALDAWQQDAAKREADAIKKIKDRATQHWLNLAKQLMLKEKMEKSQKEAETEASSSLITESKAPGEEVAESVTSTRKAAQHTHSFPPSLYTTNDDGVITRHCACGYTDTLQRL
jgi:xeroderma pigmentosum group C-complementing protein